MSNMAKVLCVLMTPVLLLVGCSESKLGPDVTMPYPRPGDVPAGERLGLVWQEVPGNPRIDTPDCPEWYCLGQTDPWVARGPDGSLVTWFSTGGDLVGWPVIW